ncbi:GNAT family N-acetyltransferase [Alteromonas halophila]|uniref:GNAT family acetyltransferase n=1 Tax=Alteromonas halophila TaxID=516698 RepID=A0A918JFG7_9ALTE|nr:GNAT family N-acetyltransferase [Alteromonas halophila]GGW75196.1 GNAT family acetyltransferase [Alteromonas halophila]
MRIDDSDRLRYEFVDDHDVEFIWQLDQDEEVMKFINGGIKTSREEIDSVFMPRLHAFRNPSLGWGLWRVIEKEHEESIGWILVRPFGFFTPQPESENIELGWRFKRKCWGKGYALEAATAVREALRDMGVETFSAMAVPDNVRSIRIMEKLGMEYQRTQRYTDDIFDGDIVVYGQSYSRYK